MKVAVNVSEARLYKSIIYQALDDLYSKNRLRRARAIAWLLDEFDEVPVVTCEEACDLYGVKRELIKMFAEAILAGKLSKVAFKEAIKEID